ncbi:endophilin-B1 isoform X2 [Bemisia tabaci]|uniref:endophilin-B1 isoform X2 n=1 Tax=Bemisia tabaci TaxID=7038 RepID=UPI0008F9A376|nr:PREDICTED: endophilin-B1 isoform X2 [Bemisia tabaci]
MDFNVKKLVREAGNAISRYVQLTEEKLGTSDRTEFDVLFENLAELSDNTKNWTEKILRDTEAVLTPNPGNRVEDYLFEKIDKKKPNRLSNLEYLGLDMIEAGNDFGPGTSYGNALIKVGQYEQKLGVVEREFIAAANQCFSTPLQKFLDNEMKTVSKERSILESKRLDLDACKNRVRKARGMLGMPAAERDLRVAQSEFDRQQEITKLLLEGVSSSRAGHLRCLHEFVEAQSNYYAKCHELMKELQQDLQSSSSNPQHSSTSNLQSSGQKAKALCDYEAKDSTELSVSADEVVTVLSECSDNPDYVNCEKGTQHGRIPKMYLLFK